MQHSLTMAGRMAPADPKRALRSAGLGLAHLGLSGLSLLCLASVAYPAVAQEAEGGLQLTFGVSLRAEIDSNADLDPVSAGRTSRLTTGLTFALTSTTRSARLALTGSADLQWADRPAGTGDTPDGVVNPSVALSYGRDWADAAFTLDASLRETDLTTARDVLDFDVDSGTRRSARLDTGLRWGEDAPLGFGVSAGVTDLSYDDAPGEADSRSERLGLTARLDLSDVAAVDLGLRGSRYDEDGGDDARDTLGFDAGLTFARPRGSLGLRLSVDDTEDGQRRSLTFSQSLELPRGALSYSLGATRGVDDETRLTGALDYSHALPRGIVSVGLKRSVNADDEDAETVVSSASLGYQQELGPLSRLNLSLTWAESETTATSLATTNTNLSATYSHDLADDWALDLGYRHRIRDEDAVGKGSSDVVFLGLRRSFTALP